MTTAVSPQAASAQAVKLPKNRGAYYGGAWHEPKAGRFVDTISPGTGQSLGKVADSGAEDIDAAVAAAKAAFKEWRRTLPLERAKILRRIAEILRQNANELAMIDAADCGNPVKEMVSDAMIAAAQMEFFAGFVTEMKGSSIPMGPDVVNFSVREPLGVVGRIIPFNHPFMFCAGKSAAPLAAGNTVVVKPPEQAPLSSLRLAELIGGLLPAGAFNVVPGGREAGQRLASHPDVAMIALIGSVPTGRAVMKAASDTVKRTMLELGGKNALIAYGDADPDEVAGCGDRRHEFHLVRPVLRLDQPGLHPRGDLRRSDRARERKDQILQAGDSDRSRHHHGRYCFQAAIRPGHELHQLRQE